MSVLSTLRDATNNVTPSGSKARRPEMTGQDESRDLLATSLGIRWNVLGGSSLTVALDPGALPISFLCIEDEPSSLARLILPTASHRVKAP